MLNFVTSLTFLYSLAVVLLLVYGLYYYRDFARSAIHKSRFPVIFSVIALACFAFLWFNIQAPLSLHTFSNTDHQFIQQDGYAVNRSIKLGGTDTANVGSNSYNSFLLQKQGSEVIVNSVYSEDPLYTGSGGKYQLLSKTFAAEGALAFHCHAALVTVQVPRDDDYILNVNGQQYHSHRSIRKGISLWNLFRDEPVFTQSEYYNDQDIVNSLRDIFLLRPAVNTEESGALRFFVSGRLFRHASGLLYQNNRIDPGDLQFKAPVPDRNIFAWGIAFFDNNKNQFRLRYGSGDSFYVMHRYPVSYPLTEEQNDDWSVHHINKFLVSDSRDMPGMAGIFREGFLFTPPDPDSLAAFSPVLLTYTRDAGDKPISMRAQYLNRSLPKLDTNINRVILPARSPGFGWIFSIRNSFNWDFGSWQMKPLTWQLLLFGSLFLFFALVLLSSLLASREKYNWVWQLLSCTTLVLLTTRFFLYWRYKSFPPYEGMDLPSQQQLNSFWNFGIIIAATVFLACMFGWRTLRYVWDQCRAQLTRRVQARAENSNNQLTVDKLSAWIENSALARRLGTKGLFFLNWFLLLLAALVLAYLGHFDPGTCRHLAIGLMVLYFVFGYLSYRYSPLVASAEKSWWRIDSNKPAEVFMSNPVKVLLAISLLAVFVFIDIGFAIVFLNFVLFNEAFLSINYAIAGLSSGSRQNAKWFGLIGLIYLAAFVLNLLYAPFIFRFLLSLPQSLYAAGYLVFALLLSFTIVRLLPNLRPARRRLSGIAASIILFGLAYFFFPKERILDKAAMTKYRIDVLTMPVDKAIETAYREGKTFEPVIRAAQNQWFINTLIYEENNPAVNSTRFHLVPHAPQNKGAKYNAQATDLVASRFLLAEHGKWSVLLFVLLLVLPTVLLGSFYKLYPDFTSRVNPSYAVVTSGFSILNYFLITALLVILAATGRYIFFGQDLPFGSILSKQSILFPSLLITVIVLLFGKISQEYYANRKKMIPGAVILGLLAAMLFFVKPSFNKNKEFNAEELAGNLDNWVQLHLQPVMDYFDSSRQTRRLSIARKDRLFTDSVRKLVAGGVWGDSKDFFVQQATLFSRGDFSRHLDQANMLYLDLYSGKPELAVNENYFRVEAPPHLQQSWKGNVYADSTIYNISFWQAKTGSLFTTRLNSFSSDPVVKLRGDMAVSFSSGVSANPGREGYLVNTGKLTLKISSGDIQRELKPGDSLKLFNPSRFLVQDVAGGESILSIEPDAFMKNYYVNGGRYYVYPLGNRFIWARNFSESIASEYTSAGRERSNAVVSFDFELMDSLSQKIRDMMARDTSYARGAEYGITVADGNGRLVAIADFIKGLARPDPNDKAGFMKTIMGENGYVSQSLLRKQIGNINLLRMNPGPGSTFKPIVFSAIASQLNLDWDQFGTQGFSQKLKFFGGERVADYDFEKNNGRIGNIIDYLKYSDNYYHSDVLLLGSYPKQDISQLLSTHFDQHKADSSQQWPYFFYQGRDYWLNGFKRWPGYANGKADFGSDSSYTAIGLFGNYGIYTHAAEKSFEFFPTAYDSSLFMSAYRKSGFILPEYGLFDQQGVNVDHRIPYDLFATCFRGHVKGSSQVLVPPVKMVEAFGKMVTQSRNYSLTMNPYAGTPVFSPFVVDKTILYNNYLSLMREAVFAGMKETLNSGTAGVLGSLLKNKSPYFYYAKTGTTGDDELRSKSKLLAIVVSKKDISDPGNNFRNNRFYTIYFTMQNGPAKQNEAFQNEIIQLIQRSPVFVKYMANRQ
jgi:hypothetical protein